MGSVLGVTVQVAPSGSVQVKLRFWLKPLNGVAATVKVALPPCFAETEVVDGVSVKSGDPEEPGEVPVPLSATVCGEFEAIPVTVRVPL